MKKTPNRLYETQHVATVIWKHIKQKRGELYEIPILNNQMQLFFIQMWMKYNRIKFRKLFEHKQSHWAIFCVYIFRIAHIFDSIHLFSVSKKPQKKTHCAFSTANESHYFFSCNANFCFQIFKCNYFASWCHLFMLLSCGKTMLVSGRKGGTNYKKLFNLHLK